MTHWKGDIVDKLDNNWSSSGYKVLQETVASSIIHNLCKGTKTLLDAGAGTCRMAKYLAKDYRYTAFDGSQEMIDKCKDVNVKKLIGDLKNTRLSDKCFDTVMCLHVVRHNPAEDHEIILHELFRIASKYVVLLNPFVSNQSNVKMIFNQEIPDYPLVLTTTCNIAYYHNFELLNVIDLHDNRKQDLMLTFRRRNAEI